VTSKTARIQLLRWLSCLTVSMSISTLAQPVNPHSALIADFQKRLENYLKLRVQAEKGLPALKPTDSSELIAQHEHALAVRIQMLRAGAKQGDVFTAPIRDEFRRLLKIAGQPNNGAEIRRSLRSAEPVRRHLRVNQTYPASLPLQSTPAVVLRNLPELPKQIEYRLIDHDLIIRDVGANLVIDFADGVVP